MVLATWFARLLGGGLRPLGELEASLLEQVWDAGEVSVRDLHRRDGAGLAYTTVMTTLDRLYKKGLLRRRKDGRAFLYSPAMTREKFAEAVARQAIAVMGECAGRSAVLSSFVNAMDTSDARLLDELERLVRSKRNAQKRGES